MRMGGAVTLHPHMPNDVEDNFTPLSSKLYK